MHLYFKEPMRETHAGNYGQPIKSCQLPCPGFCGLVMLRVFIYGILALLYIFTSLSCKKKESIPENIRIQYQANADKFCKAITGCIQKEIETRLKNQPKRRDMVLKRMNRDLCRKNQYLLLGSLQAHPMGGQAVPFNKKIYMDYDICATTLSRASNCIEVRKQYDELPECRRIRKKE